LAFQKNKFEHAIYGNSSEFSDDVITVNGPQDLHENLHIVDAAFMGYQIKTK